MKILYISTPSFADCDFPLIKSMMSSGHDVIYLIWLAPYSLKSTLFNIKEMLPEDGILPALDYAELKPYSQYMNMENVYIVNQTSGKDTHPRNLLLTKSVARFIRKGNFDVVHTDCVLSIYRSLLYLCHPHIIQTMHDPFPHSGETGMRKNFFYQICINLSKKIILLNESQRERFIASYKINPKKVYTNRLGSYDCITAFEKKGIVKRPNSILFFGRISPYKGIEYICQAMELIRKKIPDATLTIAGGGKMYFDFNPYKDKPYIKLINRYVGMEELATLLAEHSAVVCPYTDATQSGVILTAYSMKLPVIATNVGGLGEMVEDGKTGFLVAPRDIETLVDAVIKMFENEQRQQVMQQNIENYYNGNRSWKSIVDNYIKCYKDDRIFH